MNNNTLAKIIFRIIEIICLFAVSAFAYTACEWFIATLIVIFTILAISMQSEYQRLNWDDTDEEIQSQVNMWISMQEDIGR